MKNYLTAARLDRVETIYLTILRVAGLAIATVCLLAALFFLGDALWRLAVSTKVDVEPTEVASADIARAMQAAPRANAEGEREIPEEVRKTHKAFVDTFWPRYYAIYKSAFDSYKKAEDELISPADLMNNLGYGLESYAASVGGDDFSDEAMAVQHLVQNADYQTMALARVGEAMRARTTVALLTQYKAATKSEQRCVTVPQTRVIPQVCGYYYVYDCSITRTVNVERCEAVYPDGIVSPAQAFERADFTFADLYFSDRATKTADANYEISKREETRAKIGPNLQLALMIVGAFLAVMFFFLIIAIERHLRKVAHEAGAKAEALPEPDPAT